MSQNNKNKVFMMSSVHTYNDGRIMYREAASLQSNYEVELHICAPFDEKEIQGVKVYGLPMWNSPKDRLKTISILIKRIVKSNASVYHFHDPELLILVPIIKLFKGSKIIYDVHEHYLLAIMDKSWIPSIFRLLIKNIFSLLERLMLLGIDRIIYPTEKVGERYKKRKIENAVRIENVPLNDIFQKTPLPFNKRENRILFLGVVASIRGVTELIKAFSKIENAHKNYKLHFVGRFIDRTFEIEIHRLIKDLKLEKFVIIRPQIPYNEIVSELYMSKIGIVTYLPYGNNKVGLPNKIFEYMAGGLAIIASNFEGYKKILDPVNCGICVDPTNIEEISNAMKLIIGNPKKAERMSKNSRRAYLEKYNWQKEEQKLFDLYETLIPEL